MKKQIITGVFIILLTVTAIGVYFVLQKNKNNQQLIREFEIEDIKISFVQPRGWSCEQVANLTRWKEYNGTVVCGKIVNDKTIKYIINNYGRAKGNAVRPISDLFVKNKYGEFIIFRKASKQFFGANVQNDKLFESDYWKTNISMFGQNMYRSFLYNDNRLNVFGALKMSTHGNFDIINILSDGKKADWSPSEEVQIILETLSIEKK